MAKVFEDYFSEIQADMVYACMDYVNGKADKVYIYASREGRMISTDYFFEINGQIIERHKLDLISPQYDISPDHQNVCLEILNEDVDELEKLCKEHDRPMPTEIKMIYDVAKNSLGIKYKYDNQWLDHPTKGPDDIADEWFEEIKNSQS